MAKLSINPCSPQPSDPGYQSYTLEACDSTWSATIPVLFLEDSACLRWYFEDYAEREPLEISKAADAKDLLQNYSGQLAASLELWRCPASFRNSQLRLNVQVDTRPEHGSKNGLWEVLEDLAIAMLGTGSMDKHCIACLPRSMEDALYIHEVLQRNGHRNRGRRC